MVSGRLLFATRNAGKQREIREILRDPPFEIVFPDGVGLFERAEEQTLETTETFEGNARQKAEYFARRSGLPTAAEDSGIEVMSLGGLPGVRSRRFAPPDPNQDAANNQELLRRLAGEDFEPGHLPFAAIGFFDRGIEHAYARGPNIRPGPIAANKWNYRSIRHSQTSLTS